MERGVSCPWLGRGLVVRGCRRTVLVRLGWCASGALAGWRCNPGREFVREGLSCSGAGRVVADVKREGEGSMLEQVAEGVLIHQSELLANNTVVVQGRDGVLLVDAGVTGAELSCLVDDLRELGRPVVAGFSTHPDWDHVLWHTELGDAPRYGTSRCAVFMQEVLSKADWKAGVVEGLPPEIAADIPLDQYGRITGLPVGTARLPWDGPSVRIVEHPAHAPGHAALLIEEHRVLIAGDMLSDVFVPMLDDTEKPTEDYLVGLRVLEGVADGVDVLIPGHGSVARDDEVRARIERDRVYVEDLRDARVSRDPRVVSPKPGWEWTSAIHEGQARRLA